MIRIFSHYIPMRTLFLVALETLVLVLSVYFGLALSAISPDQAAASAAPLPIAPKAALLACLILVTMTAMGLYDSESHAAVGVTLTRLVMAFVTGIVFAVAAIAVFPALSVGPNALMSAFAAALFGSVFTRVRAD
jgi:hypothetical protein